MNLTSIKKSLGRWLIGLGLWSLLILIYSTHRPPPEIPVTWFETLKLSISEWCIWLLLAPILIGLDRKLPVPDGAFLQRFLYHIPLSLLISLFAINVSSFIIELAQGEIADLSFSFASFELLRRGRFLTHFLIYWVIISVYMLYNYNNLLKNREIQTAKLEQSLAEARLNTLRSQMHPHFLFNALNTISAHVVRDPRAARRMLEQLGELLRFSLNYSEEQEIPLAEEMAFIKRYLALQKARFAERLEVSIAVDTETLDAMVPPLLLEHFVENAIRHGIAPRSQKGVVEIQTQKEKDRLRLIVRDDGPGLSPGWNAAQDAGIGISNTRERLRSLYGEENFIFNVTNAEGGGVRVELLLPFHAADEPFGGD